MKQIQKRDRWIIVSVVLLFVFVISVGTAIALDEKESKFAISNDAESEIGTSLIKEGKLASETVDVWEANVVEVNNDSITMTWIYDKDKMTPDMRMGITSAKSVIQSWGANITEVDDISSATNGSDVFCFFNADSYIGDYGDVLFAGSGYVCGMNLWVNLDGNTIFLILLDGSRFYSSQTWILIIIHEVCHAYFDADACPGCDYDEQMMFYRQCLIDNDNDRVIEKSEIK